jgi:hypothetical protein
MGAERPDGSGRECALPRAEATGGNSQGVLGPNPNPARLPSGVAGLFRAPPTPPVEHPTPPGRAPAPGLVYPDRSGLPHRSGDSDGQGPRSLSGPTRTDPGYLSGAGTPTGRAPAPGVVCPDGSGLPLRGRDASWPGPSSQSGLPRSIRAPSPGQRRRPAGPPPPEWSTRTDPGSLSGAETPTGRAPAHGVVDPDRSGCPLQSREAN